MEGRGVGRKGRKRGLDAFPVCVNSTYFARYKGESGGRETERANGARRACPECVRYVCEGRCEAICVKTWKIREGNEKK